MDDKKQRITEIENLMVQTDFWTNKHQAQALIKELQDLKEELAGVGKYDKGGAIMTILSGAGGTDSEDFSSMLLKMYFKYFDKRGWAYHIVHQNENDHGGYRNITIEIDGKNVYGDLKGESGVHRLVRLSPFNTKSLRHTSFSMVEIIPKFEKVNINDIEIPDEEIRVEFSRAGGPGGQNVNKRETAVRVVHIPTNLSAHSENERAQAQNREKAIQILKGKIYAAMEADRVKKEQGMYVSKTMDIEWGNQIRSYVLHPYKLVKDHRTDVESHDPEAVFDGELDEFIEAEKKLDK
ncbi:MAG: PCRF domain-containing protein [Minisyncoccia bacterium]